MLDEHAAAEQAAAADAAAGAERTDEPGAERIDEPVGERREERQADGATDRDTASTADAAGPEDFGRGLRFADVDAAHTAIVDSTLHGRDFVFAMGDGHAPRVQPVDITDLVERDADCFVAPPGLDAIEGALATDRVVLLAGPGWGKARTAAAVLHANGNRPLLNLAVGDRAPDVVAAVERASGRDPRAGFVIAVDAEALHGLSGFELRRLRAALADHGAAVLTCDEPEDRLPHLDGLTPIQGEPPDPREVAAAAARRRELGDEDTERAVAAVELLSPPVSPAAAVQIVDAARGSDLVPELLADAIDATPQALDEWLGAHPTARPVAALAAAATCDGVPLVAVDAEATRLERMLNADAEQPTEARTFGPVDRGWPAGVVRAARTTLATPLGPQDAEVVEICRPYGRDRVVRYLWQRVGPDFRAPYVEWLRGLAASPNPMVRSSAGATAGILFAIDPMAATGMLLEPWIADGRWRQLACAGLALGVPAMVGAERAPAQRLALAWASSGDVRRRKAATFAYGGLLGRSEPTAAARLWELGDEGGEVRAFADRALVFLTVGGADAAYARASAIALLDAHAGSQPEPRRAYRLLPRVVGALVGRGGDARESLEALLSERERESFAGLSALMARGFDVSAGHQSAASALRVLLRALGDGRADLEVALRLIREMKAAARERGRLAALGSQIERVLRREIRARGDTATAAQAVHEQFFEERGDS